MAPDCPDLAPPLEGSIRNLGKDRTVKIVDHPSNTPGIMMYSAGTAFFFLLTCSHWVFAEAFRILDQSAAATGQGSAFVAQADDASAVYFNPAALVRLPGIQTTAGTLLIGGQIHFHPNESSPIEGNFGSFIANPPPSSLFLTANLGSLGLPSLQHVTAGLGIHSPFGNLTSYPKDSTLSPIIISSALPLLDIKPTIAFEINKDISVGLGLDIYTFSGLFGEGQVELHQDGQDFSATGLATAGEEVELNGADTSLGFNLSFLLTLLRNPREQPMLNVGLVYRSQATLHLEGLLINQTRGTSLPAQAELPLPQVVTMGIAYWPDRTTHHDWKVELDLDYTDWTSFQNLDVTLANGLVLPKPKNWNSSYTVMLGTEYTLLAPSLLPDWEVAYRGGWVYGSSPVPERTFSPDVPDSNYHALSVGVGVECKSGGKFLGFIECGHSGPGPLKLTSISLDLAYQALLYESRIIRDNIDPLGRVDGRWDTIIHVGAVNVHLGFDPGT